MPRPGLEAEDCGDGLGDGIIGAIAVHAVRDATSLHGGLDVVGDLYLLIFHVLDLIESGFVIC